MEKIIVAKTIYIIKNILPAVFCIGIIITAVYTGGANLQEVPARTEMVLETQPPVIETRSLTSKKVNNIKKVKKNKENTKENTKTEVNMEGLKDGTFTGTGTGFGGEIKSSVTIKNGKITNIKILSASGETPSYLKRAKSVLSLVIDKQTYNVDSVSGATYSSNGIIESIKNALKLAQGKKPLKDNTAQSADKKKKKSSSKAKDKSAGKKKTKNKIPANTSGLKDGLYTGTGTGFGGEIKVNVRIKKGKINKIIIVSAGLETPSYFDKAKDIIDIMIKKQSTDVDAVSGATYSSNGIKEAVNNALIKAAKKKGKDTDNKDKDKKDNNKIDNDNTDSKKDDDSSGNDNTDSGIDTDNIENNNTEDNNNIEDNGEWVLISEISEDYIYPVIAFCEPYSDDFEGYDIGFKIIITTVITEEQNALKLTRITTNTYVSAIELGQDTIDYVMETGNWAFLDMAANGTAKELGLFEQLVSSNSTENFDVVSGATCSSDALVYGIKNTLADITLGKTVVIN